VDIEADKRDAPCLAVEVKGHQANAPALRNTFLMGLGQILIARTKYATWDVALALTEDYRRLAKNHADVFKSTGLGLIWVNRPSPSEVFWTDSLPLPVESWAEVYEEVLKRAAEADVRFREVGIRCSENLEHFKRPIRVRMDGRDVFVEGNLSANEIRRRVDRVLREIRNPGRFLTVVCDDGSDFRLPAAARP
jgi:hypothetical protein